MSSEPEKVHVLVINKYCTEYYLDLWILSDGSITAKKPQPEPEQNRYYWQGAHVYDRLGSYPDEHLLTVFHLGIPSPARAQEIADILNAHEHTNNL